MKYVVKAFSSLVFSIVSVTATAQEEPHWSDGIYVGGSYGYTTIEVGAQMTVDNENGPIIDANLDDPYSSGVTQGPVNYYSDEQKPVTLDFFAGYRFMEAMGGDIGVELRYATSVTQTIFNFTDVSFSAAGLYGTYKTQGPVYLKALLGMGQSTYDVNGGEYVTLNKSETGISWGFAIGQEIFGGAIELMYMIYPDVRLDSDEQQFEFSYDISGAPCPGGDNCTDSVINLSDKISFSTLSVGYIYSF